MKHRREPLKEPNGFLGICLVLRHPNDVVKDGRDFLQPCNALGCEHMKKGRECDHDGLIMLLELLAAGFERLDLLLLSRNNFSDGQHLLSQSIQRSIHVSSMPQNLMSHVG